MRSSVGALASVALLSLGAAAWSERANAQSFNQFIGFGDSSIDSGWFLTHKPETANKTQQTFYNASAAIGGGIPATPGGLMNSQVLSSYFGLTAIPVGETGGTNYAASGATNASNANGFSLANGFAPATPTQIQTYLNSTGGVANPNALYLISSGGNDISKVICPNTVCGATGQQQGISAANLLVTGVAQLYGAGARYVVVATSFGAKTPQDPAFLPGSPEALVKDAYNQALYGGLAAAGINFIPASGKAIGDAIGSNPALFGFTNVLAGSTTTLTGGACVNPITSGPNAIKNSWALDCTTLVAPNAQNTYLFADDEHYSTAGQKIEADYIYSLITAPSEISYLGEVPVKTRAGVINAIDNQIPISLGQPGQYHGWVSGDVSWLKMSNSNPGFPDDPGTPGAVTAGFDFRVTPNWLIGAAFSGGTTYQSFSLGGGFNLNEFAVSLYAAYLDGPFWGNAIASAGGLYFNANRQVPIGITTQPNTSNTTGSNYSLMLETGYDFNSPIGTAVSLMPVKAAPATLTITHGPVIGITLQQVHVNGFTETDQFAGDGSGGFTALSFIDQTRNSAVSELGYRASVDVGIWHPFAKLVWDHELANTDRLVTAFLTTTSFAPGYSLPAVVFGNDWGTATLGTTVKLSKSVTGFATFISQFGEHSVTNYGGQFGFNVVLDSMIASAMPVKAPIYR